MANTLNITEVTMAQLALASNAINLRSARPDALSQGGPLVVRVTDHVDNDAAETGADTEKMAIFTSRQFGQPWKKDYGLSHVVAENNVVNTSATVVFPNYDYSTFN